VIGNCQAGGALMSLASLRPELFSPFVVPPNEWVRGVSGRTLSSAARPTQWTWPGPAA